MNRIHIDFISFYITNVCGLACVGCASFNNYVLKEHYKWSVAKEKTAKWGEILSLNQISIIGGEPLLHPEIDEWVMGVRSAFPHVDDIRVFTGLTDKKLLRYKEQFLNWLHNNVTVQVSIHDPSWWEPTIESAREIFDGIDFTVQRRVDAGSSFPFKTINFITPRGDIIFSMLEQWDFFHSATKEIKEGVMYFHTNDPEDAHTACLCKDCHYIVDGDIYKCVITGTAKMIVDQLPIDERSKNLLEQVKGLDPFVDGWQSEIKNYVPQCSLCSTKTQVLIPAFPIPIKKEKLTK